MKSKYWARALLSLMALALFLSVVYAEHTNKSKEDEERAAGALIASTGYDIASLPTWDEAPQSSVRMIYGWYYAQGEIETSDGHIWDLNTDGINKYETVLLWFDTMNTPEIEDDQIVKVWKEVYD